MRLYISASCRVNDIRPSTRINKPERSGDILLLKNHYMLNIGWIHLP
jgi:hypothetical protein